MRRMRFFRSFLIIMMALFVAVMFSACDFFSYEKGTSAEELAYQKDLEQKQTEYIEALNGLSSEEVYYEEERRAYVLCLLEGINEIRDCEKIELLDTVFEKRKDAILSIKTISDYEEEERLKSEQLANAKEEFVSKLNALSSEENYREAELVTYRFYLKTATDEINNCEEQEFLEEIFNTYKEVIVSVKTASEYEAEETAAYAAFCETKIQEIRNHLTLSAYRKEQADQITAYISEYETKIEEASDYDAVENIVREYKITVYPIKTDAELYAEELAEAISEAIEEVGSYVNVLDYRANEAQIVTAILEAFNGQVAVSETIEEVARTVSTYKGMLDSVKTDATLYYEEKMQIVEEGYSELLGIVDLDSADEEWSQSYRDYCERIKEEMTVLATKEEVLEKLSAEKKVAYLTGAQANDPRALKSYQEILISDITNYNDVTQYREEQRRDLLSIRSSFSTTVKQIITYDETIELYETTLLALDSVLTNDQMWELEDDEFRAQLRELYGEYILTEPQSLSEADNYVELAEIIDYYAFYQIDGESFVRDRFRVKLNWQHKDAIWERNEVYWYCELLKSAVDIKAEFDGNSDCLIFTLIPYAFATVSNAADTQKIERKKSAVQFDSNKSAQTERADDFDEFAYYNYGKSATVWNSQQLWYALEHGYVPQCVEGSTAERILDAAKQILRQIIREGMSDEEKIFQIYKWFGENVQYDHLHVNYNFSSDPDNLPNEKISALQSHFIEGAIYDGLVVCIGYAKTYLLMLRIEGIEAKFNLARMPYMAGTNSIYSIAGAFHGYVLIKLNNQWYYSDVQKSFAGAGEELISYSYLCLPGAGSGMYEVVNRDLEMGQDILYYRSFTHNGNKLFVGSKEELYELLDEYFQSGGEFRLSVFYNISIYRSCYEDIIEYEAIYDRRFELSRVDANGFLREAIISL